MAGDDPADVANERFFEAVLGEHPLGRPIGGNPETIRAATREAVLEHYRANYRPQDLVVTRRRGGRPRRAPRRAQRALDAPGWDLGVEAAPVDRRSRSPRCSRRARRSPSSRARSSR